MKIKEYFFQSKFSDYDKKLIFQMIKLILLLLTPIIIILILFTLPSSAYTVTTTYIENKPFTQYGESYQVMIHPSVDTTQVKSKLSQFNRYYHFEIIEYNKKRIYYNYIKGIYLPKDEWTILITHDNHKGVIGRCEGTSIGIEVSTQMNFNTLLQHELNHVYYGCLADTVGFNPNLDEMYNRWLYPNKTIVNIIRGG